MPVVNNHKTTTAMRTKEELKQQIRQLVDGDLKNNLPQIRAIEAQIKDLEVAQLLAGVNGKQQRLRDLAAQIWACEIPTEDITNMDGSINKNKAKKYPKLAALPYCTLKFDGNILTDVYLGGQRFTMCSTVYDYGKPNQYTRPTSYEGFLALNGIQAADITTEQYLSLKTALNALNEQIEAQIEQYKTALAGLDIYNMANIGLVQQRNANFYKYETNI